MRVRRLSIVLFPPALILGSLLGASPVLAAPCDGSTTSLGNGDFETPVVPADTYVLLPAASVPPWQTTDGAGEIELWGTGFLGVPAFEGNAFAELNANTAGTLYQDVVSTSGEVMTWSLAHRGREGDDVMQVLIGDANAADVNGTAGWDYISPDLTDGVDAWGTHTDQFVVPTGQTCTRLAFRAVVARIRQRFHRQLPRRRRVRDLHPAATRNRPIRPRRRRRTRPLPRRHPRPTRHLSGRPATTQTRDPLHSWC